MMDGKFSLGSDESGLPPDIIDKLKATPRISGVDTMFLNRAEQALRDAGYGAIEFLEANPAASEIELAKRLNRGCNAIGLVMAIYVEAMRTGKEREIARSLLVRRICNEFPLGWDSELVYKLGAWMHQVDKYIGYAAEKGFAEGVVRYMREEISLPDGWRPKSDCDPVIEEVFDRCWPV